MEISNDKAPPCGADKVPLSGAALPPTKYCRSPRERGEMDKYYGRPRSPHYYAPDPDNSLWGEYVGAALMTPDEIEAYRRGYEEETDRKDWGYD